MGHRAVAAVSAAGSTEELRFTSGHGATLSGVLHRPAAPPRAGVLLAHCFTCSKDIHTMTRLARGLAASDHLVLRFDFTGLGESGGEFGASNVATGVEDVVAAANVLASYDPGPLGMLGHSLGGAASLLAAPYLDTVASVVVLGAPSTPAHLAEVLPSIDPHRRTGAATWWSASAEAAASDDRDQAADQARSPDPDTCPVIIAGRRFEVRRGFLDDLHEHDQAGAVAQLGRPLLVLHPEHDQVVPVSEGERIFAAARQPKAFLPILGADHLVRDRSASERVLEAVRWWFATTL